jgi:tRNA(Phe) wybutosine-synthesizing methylase Tyw3
MLPSFPSIRERNLRTLYGNGGGVTDKSPKGSVDVKIRPLVDLINRHPEYVTLSSCSGRVALFDPTAGSSTDTSTTDDDAKMNQLLDDHRIDDTDEGRSDALNNWSAPTSTNSSGKGHGGKWIFVTHDTLPDLGAQIIHSLKQVGRERLLPVAANYTANSSNTSTSTTPMLPITFKHEPPLLHIAASNIESGMRLLRIIKSAPTCAMRESGLVVTDKRVTVEIRTTSTMLTLPIMVRRGGRLFPSSASSSRNDNNHQKEKEEGATTKDGDDVILAPDEEYLMSLSEIANERMIHNESLLDGLFSVIQKELFGNEGEAVVQGTNGVASSARSNGSEDDNKFPMNEMARRDDSQDFERHVDDEVAGDSDVYNVTVQSTLPPLNLWKTAVVVLPRNNNCATSISSMEEIDLDVIAFGGQGVGPTIMPTQNSDAVSSIDFVDDVENNCTPQASTTCKRWNSVFRLRRQGGVWSKHWDVLPTVCDKDNSLWNLDAGTAYPIHTSSGIFGLTPSKDGMGCREGHTTCVIPRFDEYKLLDKDTPPPDAVIVFGGRTSGRGQGLRPTNDLFVYVTDPSYNSSLCNNDTASDNIKENNRHAHSSKGLFGRPSDVRGTAPEPRYGHTMNLLPNNTFVSNDATPFAVIAGGTGMSSSVEGTGASSFVCLNSIYTLTCIVQVEQRNDDKYPHTRSHLMWNRIANMPSPRSYHTSVIYGNHMFVFGGYAEADDPFLSSPSLLSWCTIPLNSGIESTTATENSSVTDEVPSRIGSSAVTLDLDSSTVVLLVGGARSTTITATHSHNEGCDSPLILFAPKNEHHHHEDYLDSPMEFVRPRLQLLPETDGTVDFGSCVHHCLLALPQRQDDFGAVVVPDDTASAISIGGGVPCFSFGQSYAR